MVANTWVTLIRDLQGDLWSVGPDCDIFSVDSFHLQNGDENSGYLGSGYLDILTPSAYSDTGHDLIPNAVGSSTGLGPNDPDDAALDSDNDGVGNLHEFLNGTLYPSRILDGDGRAMRRRKATIRRIAPDVRDV